MLRLDANVTAGRKPTTGLKLGAVAQTSVGEVGGSILSLVVGYILTEFGLAPVWVKPLLVLPVALLAAIAFIGVIK